MTIHDLIADLTEYLSLTPEQQFRVTAKVKRLIHCEKHSVYMRYAHYSEGHPIFEGSGEDAKKVGNAPPADPWLHQILSLARDNHRDWSGRSDEEIVTWNVGTHKFKQREPK